MQSQRQRLLDIEAQLATQHRLNEIPGGSHNFPEALGEHLGAIAFGWVWTEEQNKHVVSWLSHPGSQIVTKQHNCLRTGGNERTKLIVLEGSEL